MRQRHSVGSVRFDKRRGTWNYLFYDHGKRRSKLIGTKHDYPTKAAAWKMAAALQTQTPTPKKTAPTVLALLGQFRTERMPKRYSTRRGYESWFKNHIVPAWGNCPITDVQARPVDIWLQSLALAPKSRAEVRGLIRLLWEFAMWCGDVPTQRNPMELVTVKGATRRKRKPRSLTVDEFQKFVRHLQEPFHAIALICVLWPSYQRMPSSQMVRRGLAQQHTASSARHRQRPGG